MSAEETRSAIHPKCVCPVTRKTILVSDTDESENSWAENDDSSSHIDHVSDSEESE